jgi:hypothetical protein
MDEVRRAYAALGLPDGAALAVVRKRYRALVRKWHPDRFVADPQGQAEASIRMRVINAAYRRLIRQFRSQAPPQVRNDPKPLSETHQRRLSREEIDAMVEAIGTEGPFDGLLGALGWVGSTIEAVLAALFGVGLVVRLTMIVTSGEWEELRHYPELALALGVVILLGLREYLQRRRLAAIVHDEGSSSG